jgi:6-phosphogluconolactonase/glucosamine-6-phosphate isomerase/deaminase
VLIAGSAKAEALAAWVTGAGPPLPIARVDRSSTVVFTDDDAARLLPPGHTRR